MKKDKEKVIDEVWTPERVRSFLYIQPPTHLHADFHCLLRAYQSMRSSDFRLFVQYFCAAGRDINVRNDRGATLLEIISQHRHASEFIAVLRQAGVQKK